MSDYTVVLKRPLQTADLDVGCDPYICFTQAPSAREAVGQAQEEVFDADVEDGQLDMEGLSPTDYELVVVFEGNCNPALISWQY